MNNPVRAYERSEWRSAGYRHHPCAIVCKTGFRDFRVFRVFQTPVSVGGLQPRTSCLRHSYGVIIFRGMKPLNPCSARLSLYRHKNIRYIYKHATHGPYLRKVQGRILVVYKRVLIRPISILLQHKKARGASFIALLGLFYSVVL